MKTQNAPIVVMADDDDDDCTLAKDAFKKSGAPGTLLCVENGIELMEYLARSDRLPALILLDLNMPRKDGRHALKEIKAIPAFRHIPIVVLTTSQEEKDKTFSLELGAKSFISKPVRFAAWVDMMKSLGADWLVRT